MGYVRSGNSLTIPGSRPKMTTRNESGFAAYFGNSLLILLLFLQLVVGCSISGDGSGNGQIGYDFGKI